METSRAGAKPASGTASAAKECNFLTLLSCSPAARDAYLACHTGLDRGQLTPRQRELLALTVAEINGAKYCLSAHFAAGKQAGLTEEDMKYARKAAARDPQTDALLRFVQEVTLQRGDVSDSDFSSLKKAGFGDGQIAEIIANIALNIFTNYFNNLVRTEVDFPLLQPDGDVFL
jgi:uncharacterized peroxidase-related enzyme